MSKGALGRVLMLRRLGLQAGSLGRVTTLAVLAAAALLAVFLVVHDSQPVQADHGGRAHLSGLSITGTVTRGGETYTFPLIANPWFDPQSGSYTIRVPSDLQGITFTPTWTVDAVERVELYDRADSIRNTLGARRIGQVTVSGTTLTNSSTRDFLILQVHDAQTRGTNDMWHFFTLQRASASLGFDGATIADKTYTAGGEISLLGLSEDEKDALRLPKATGGFYNVTYTATGLPEGLTMGQDRIIRGAPTTATTIPAEVDYTATDDTGASASLTFHVTVNPPVTFDAEDLNTYYGRVITYTAGQAEPLTVTLPEATGGTGTLTYELVFRTDATVAPSVPGAGVHLDPSTRVLTIDGNSNDNRIALRDTGYAISYRARDENGATAAASSSISVIGPPTLSNIADQSYTAGTAVSLTLGAASGPWWKMVAPLSYELTPQVDGLVFSGGSNPTLSGTPTVAGVTAMTYTATDGNGVSATKTFTVTVVNGPNAPTTAPTSLAASQITGVDAAAAWDAVTGATGYVVQVIADGGSYLDRAVNSAPAGVHLKFITGGVGINGLDPGDYKVRVAARNADGVGPWSAEVSFTVSVGGI